MDTKGKKLLEIGCANSQWLSYFDKEFGFNVSGLDYSEDGCAKAGRILANEGVRGEIICSDFFTPPDNMTDRFDVIVSFGVVEHFQDTAQCISAFSRFLKPGGLIITNIPNLSSSSLNGFLQKRVFDRKIYDIHVPLSAPMLEKAHKQAGLTIVACDYFICFNLGILNMERWRGSFLFNPLVRMQVRITKSIWVMNNYIPILPVNRITAPYIMCIAQKPCA